MAIITCPNCRNKFPSKHMKNRWVEWFEGYCYNCGWNFKLKDEDFEVVQPSNPLFEEIYKDNPTKKFLKEKEEQKKNRGNYLDDIFLKWKSKLRPWERDYAKKYILEKEE